MEQSILSVAERVVAAIRAVHGVQSANLWTRVEGKERIYVEFTKKNGGRDWNGGVGHKLVVDLATGLANLDANGKWAGAATRDWHLENETITKVRECCRPLKALAKLPDPVARHLSAEMYLNGAPGAL